MFLVGFKQKSPNYFSEFSKNKQIISRISANLLIFASERTEAICTSPNHSMANHRMKKCNMYLVYLKTIIICLLVFVFQSCESSDTPEPKCVRKKIYVYFEGNTEAVFPWVSFVAYTENHQTLYIMQDGDAIIKNDGTFNISRGNIPQSGKIVLYSDLKDSEWIYLGVTYRKRMENPSETDELKIRIQGYVNDIQYLDTMHVMPAFKSDEKIDESDYIYKLKI